jgi:hypothetical protein
MAEKLARAEFGDVYYKAIIYAVETWRADGYITSNNLPWETFTLKKCHRAKQPLLNKSRD